MILFATKNRTNPYEFVQMEKWCCKDGRFEGYVGYTGDGDIYLTWDTRDNIPVFSGSCRIGKTTTLDDFHTFRGLFHTLEGRWIEQIDVCTYYMLGQKITCYFNSKPSPPCTEPASVLSLRLIKPFF